MTSSSSYHLTRLGDKLHALGYPYYFDEAPKNVTEWKPLRDIVVFCEDTVIRALPPAERPPMLHSSNERDFVSKTIPQYIKAIQANAATRRHAPYGISCHLETIAQCVEAHSEKAEGATDAEEQNAAAQDALRAEAKASAKPFLGFGIRSQGGSILTEGIKAGGPAFRAGLQMDEKVIRICDQSFKLVAEAKKIVAANAKVGNLIKLTLLRDDREVDVTIPVCTTDEKYKQVPDLYMDPNANVSTNLSSPASGRKFDIWLDHECPARLAVVSLVESIATTALMLTVEDGEIKAKHKMQMQKNNDSDAAANEKLSDDDDDEQDLTWPALKQAYLQWSTDHARRLITSVEQPPWWKKQKQHKKSEADATTGSNTAVLRKVLEDVAKKRGMKFTQPSEKENQQQLTTSTFIEHGNLVRTLRSFAILRSAQESRAKLKGFQRAHRVPATDPLASLDTSSALKALSTIHIPTAWTQPPGTNNKGNASNNNKAGGGGGELNKETILQLLRLVFTQDLRTLQDTINEGIGELQNLTATCRTDARLGRVGT